MSVYVCVCPRESAQKLFLDANYPVFHTCIECELGIEICRWVALV